MTDALLSTFTEDGTGPTIKEIFDSLRLEQRVALEAALQSARNYPYTVDQIELFAFFLAEGSFGSMTKKTRPRTRRRTQRKK